MSVDKRFLIVTTMALGFWAAPAMADGQPAAAAAPKGPIPTVQNKDTILHDVDKQFGGAASVEYIFVTPGLIRAMGKNIDSETSTNPFGHAVIRYTLPNGTQKLMNIVGKPGAEMVNFLDPSDYLYATNVKGSEQGGAMNRTMHSVRIEHVAPEKVVALDKFYTELAERHQAGKAKFDLAAPVIRNAFNGALGRDDAAEAGNCALWVSKGLAHAGIIAKPTMWPKKLFAQVLEQQRAIDPSNVHVVTFEQGPDGNHGAQTHGLYSPLGIRKSAKYWNPGADAVVRLTPGTKTLHIDMQRHGALLTPRNVASPKPAANRFAGRLPPPRGRF
jgi:hypothetical protein